MIENKGYIPKSILPCLESVSHKHGSWTAELKYGFVFRHSGKHELFTDTWKELRSYLKASNVIPEKDRSKANEDLYCLGKSLRYYLCNADLRGEDDPRTQDFYKELLQRWKQQYSMRDNLSQIYRKLMPDICGISDHDDLRIGDIARYGFDTDGFVNADKLYQLLPESDSMDRMMIEGIVKLAGM